MLFAQWGAPGIVRSARLLPPITVLLDVEGRGPVSRA